VKAAIPNPVLLTYCFQTFLIQQYREVCSKDWDNDHCVFVHKFLVACVKDFCKEHLELDLKRQDLKVLSGCRITKCSFHVMVPKIVLDRNYMSCRYLSWEFARYVWVRIGTNMTNRCVWGGCKLELEVFLRLGMLEKQADGIGWFGMNDTPVDEVIYSRSRQFRMVGMSKLGGLPMKALLPKDKDVMVIGVAVWKTKRDLIELGYKTWLSYLVCPASHRSVLSFYTSPYFPFRLQVGRAFEGLFGVTSLKSKCWPVKAAMTVGGTRRCDCVSTNASLSRFHSMPEGEKSLPGIQGWL
jgi:hypothetical protein